MALLVLGYPSISASDSAWIQSIRQQHDPQFELVAPHFTLVFPTDGVEVDEFSHHVRSQIRGQAPIAFEVRCALVVKDALGAATHTFLVPDQGFSDLVKLHDRLYSGILAPHLRLDLPFIPHITIAAAHDPAVCKRVAGEINSQEIIMRGTISALDLVRFANQTVTTLEQLVLGASDHP